MVYRGVDELATDIYSTIRADDFIQGVRVDIEGPILKSRLFIETDVFIDVFFNSMTGTISYTVVKNRSRIFGIDMDNIRGWHEHSLEHPDTHAPCKPVTFKEFYSQVMKNKNAILV